MQSHEILKHEETNVEAKEEMSDYGVVRRDGIISKKGVSWRDGCFGELITSAH